MSGVPKTASEENLQAIREPWRWMECYCDDDDSPAYPCQPCLARRDAAAALGRVAARLALLEEVAEAADQAAILEYDPRASDAANDSLQRRSRDLRLALSRLNSGVSA